jgi:hypothetical protein
LVVFGVAVCPVPVVKAARVVVRRFHAVSVDVGVAAARREWAPIEGVSALAIGAAPMATPMTIAAPTSAERTMSTYLFSVFARR